ncbi:hypothetical protein LTR53_018399, partial [Teratosphaeriaceae sp. CCFEE 6253]
MEEPPLADKKPPRPRSRTPKVPKPDKTNANAHPHPHPLASTQPRAPRPPGQPGTNAHSALAGISTSNALLALARPPPDAAKGSRWLPWMKLTEWEMAKLRKRMKKNAIWHPSQTMVRRELKNLGRGTAGREAARQAAEEGEVFVDEAGEPDPTKIMVSGEETAQIDALLGGPQTYAEDEDVDAELINRGMRLNEAKKMKRARVLEEMALQAQVAREAGGDAVLPDGKALGEGGRKRKRE